MKTKVHVQIAENASWQEAELSTEHAEPYGVPVVVVGKQGDVHQPAETYRIQALDETDQELFQDAARAGYKILR